MIHKLPEVRGSIRRLVRNRRGATMVEYAVLLVLILVAAAATFRTLGAGVGKGAASAEKAFGK
jgi:Flp pilus assembly pilin Flp